MGSDLKLLPSQVEYVLATAIGKRLMKRYAHEFGDRSNFFAVAILNRAFLMETDARDALHFREQHVELIEREAHAIYADDDLAHAFSLLYSFMLIRIGPTDSERSHALAQTAMDLNIELRTPEEFCGPCNASEFLDYVQRYATNLLGYTPAVPK